eukprot:gene1500-4658_t
MTKKDELLLEPQRNNYLKVKQRLSAALTPIIVLARVPQKCGSALASDKCGMCRCYLSVVRLKCDTFFLHPHLHLRLHLHLHPHLYPQ